MASAIMMVSRHVEHCDGATMRTVAATMLEQYNGIWKTIQLKLEIPIGTSQPRPEALGLLLAMHLLVNRYRADEGCCYANEIMYCLKQSNCLFYVVQPYPFTSKSWRPQRPTLFRVTDGGTERRGRLLVLFFSFDNCAGVLYALWMNLTPSCSCPPGSLGHDQ